MKINIDREVEAKLVALQKVVSEQMGLTPNNYSLMVEVLLEWALKRIKPATVRIFGPRMLSLSQQRKAVIDQMIANQANMDGKQIKKMMRSLAKLRRNETNVAPSETQT